MENTKYVIYPEIVWIDRTLSPSEKLCWVMYASHCIGKEKCWPSQERIAAMMGVDMRHVRRMTRKLVDKGHLILHRASGKVNTYEIPRTHRAGVIEGSNSSLYDTPDTQSLTPRTPMSYHPGHTEPIEVLKKKIIKEEEHNISHTTKKPSNKPPRTREEVQQQLDAIDYTKHREKWEHEIDFDDALERFKDHVLNGSLKKEKPNPSGWVNLDRALGVWCSNSKKWGGNGGTPSQKKFTGVLPSSDSEEVKAIRRKYYGEE